MAWRAPLLFLVLAAPLSCGSVQATDGETFPVPSFLGRSYADAARASAAHDIPCGPGNVAIVGATTYSEQPQLVTVEGCGQRVTYNISCGNHDCQCVLAARLDVRRGS